MTSSCTEIRINVSIVIKSWYRLNQIGRMTYVLVAEEDCWEKLSQPPSICYLNLSLYSLFMVLVWRAEGYAS